MNRRISIRLSEEDFQRIKGSSISISQWVRSAIRRKIHETRTTLYRRKIRRKEEPEFRNKLNQANKDWLEKNLKNPDFIRKRRDYGRRYMMVRRMEVRRI